MSGRGFAQTASVAGAVARARPDQVEGLAVFAVEQAGEERREEARVVELQGEIFPSFVRAFGQGRADFGLMRRTA